MILLILVRLLGEDGILLFPSHPTFAPFHRESYLKPMNFVYTAIFNALGFPVTQVPLGLDSDTGLPLGIQVVGGMYMDRLTIAVAKDLEKAFGGWKCPAKIL
ncbi:Fatty-acid amide hydrolase 2 [Armadillidium vulgare]|nr:Fatty-acid amide hydrolase 2 [Armadillidium vulgare]